MATGDAKAGVAGLTPCSESPEFLDRAEMATTAEAERRFQFYADSDLLCGEDGLPHLIVDGRWSHAGEFLIPSVLFLYIAGWIGWVGRSYLQAIKKEGKPEEKKSVSICPWLSALPPVVLPGPSLPFKSIRLGPCLLRMLKFLFPGVNLPFFCAHLETFHARFCQISFPGTGCSNHLVVYHSWDFD